MKTANLKTYAICLMALCAMPQLHAAQNLAKVLATALGVYTIYVRTTNNTTHEVTTNDNENNKVSFEDKIYFSRDIKHLQAKVDNYSEQQKQDAIAKFDKRKDNYQASTDNNSASMKKEYPNKKKGVTKVKLF